MKHKVKKKNYHKFLLIEISIELFKNYTYESE